MFRSFYGTVSILICIVTTGSQEIKIQKLNNLESKSHEDVDGLIGIHPTTTTFSEEQNNTNHINQLTNNEDVGGTKHFTSEIKASEITEVPIVFNPTILSSPQSTNEGNNINNDVEMNVIEQNVLANNTTEDDVIPTVFLHSSTTLSTLKNDSNESILTTNNVEIDVTERNIFDVSTAKNVIGNIIFNTNLTTLIAPEISKAKESKILPYNDEMFITEPQKTGNNPSDNNNKRPVVLNKYPSNLSTPQTAQNLDTKPLEGNTTKYINILQNKVNNYTLEMYSTNMSVGVTDNKTGIQETDDDYIIKKYGKQNNSDAISERSLNQAVIIRKPKPVVEMKTIVPPTKSDLNLVSLVNMLSWFMTPSISQIVLPKITITPSDPGGKKEGPETKTETVEVVFPMCEFPPCLYLQCPEPCTCPRICYKSEVPVCKCCPPCIDI